MAAGIFALLNDLRISQGKPTLGFLNPFIYQTAAAHPDAFTGKIIYQFMSQIVH